MNVQYIQNDGNLVDCKTVPIFARVFHAELKSNSPFFCACFSGWIQIIKDLERTWKLQVGLERDAIKTVSFILLALHASRACKAVRIPSCKAQSLATNVSWIFPFDNSSRKLLDWMRKARTKWAVKFRGFHR